MPWITLGGAVTPVVVALPGLSDGLLPLSDSTALAALATLPHERLPFRLLAVSYRHPVDVGVTTADLADDVAVFVRDGAGGPVAVTGHSMGGMVAQWLAIRHPDLVTHLAARHAALSQTALGHDAADHVHAIACPTLVLAGSHDPVVPVAASRQLAAAIPGARFEVAQGLRHGFPEQARDQTYRAVAGLIGLAQEVGG